MQLIVTLGGVLVVVVFVAVPAGFVTSRSNVWAPGVSGPVATLKPLARVGATDVVPSVITPVLPVGEKVPVRVVPPAQAGVVLAALNVAIVGAATMLIVAVAAGLATPAVFLSTTLIAMVPLAPAVYVIRFLPATSSPDGPR